MLNPIRNVERAPGPGGPELGRLPKAADPLRRRPHMYPVKRKSPVLAVHLAIPKMQDGGDFEDSSAAPDPQDLREPDDNLSPRDQQMKEIVVEAMAALRGQHPDPEKAIQRFVAAFGEDNLRELQQMMSQDRPDDDEEEEGDQPPDEEQNENDIGTGPRPSPGGMQVGGLLHGPGTGQSDEIEASTPAGRRVLLSDGEYVIDAPTVAILGDGSTDAGARRLDHFRKAVRQQAYGHGGQAKPLRGGARAAMLEALNR